MCTHTEAVRFREVRAAGVCCKGLSGGTQGRGLPASWRRGERGFGCQSKLSATFDEKKGRQVKGEGPVKEELMILGDSEIRGAGRGSRVTGTVEPRKVARQSQVGKRPSCLGQGRAGLFHGRLELCSVVRT